ncbi:MAG: hypothetical protein ABI432_11555 [Flavobacteriales bacterium]
MRILALLPLFTALGALSQAGALDPTFGTGGIVHTNFPNVDVNVRDLAVQSDGKILALCLMYDDPSYIRLIRYNTDGTYDTGFGTGGFVEHWLGYDYLGVGELCVLPDGRIMLVADVLSQMMVVSYLPDGTPDGTLMLNTATGGVANTIIAQPDGKIVVAGSVLEASLWKIGVVRLLPDGNYDTTFGGDGLVTTDIEGSNYEAAYGAALQPDGSILVCGYTTTGFCVLRYLTDGTLDPSFNGDGIFTHETGVANQPLQAMVLQPDGKVLAVGTSSNPQFMLLRLNADGTLDGSFAEDGIASASPGQYSNGVDLALQPDGGIIIGGGVYDSGGPHAFAVMRFDPQGVPDPTFDGDGLVITGFVETGLSCPAVALDAQWNIMLAGTTYSDEWTYLTIVRYLNDVTIGIGEHALQQAILAPNTLTVHPTPASQRVIITLPTGLASGFVRLFNAHGALVRELRYPDGAQAVMERDGLPSGVYSAIVIGDNGVQAKGRVIFE